MSDGLAQSGEAWGQPEIFCEFYLKDTFPPGLIVSGDFLYYTSEIKNAITGGILAGGSLEGLFRVSKSSEGADDAIEITRSASIHNMVTCAGYIYYRMDPVWGPEVQSGEWESNPGRRMNSWWNGKNVPWVVDFAPDPEGRLLFWLECGAEGGLKVMPTNGSEPPRLLVTRPAGSHFTEGSLLVDGQFVYYPGDDATGNAFSSSSRIRMLNRRASISFCSCSACCSLLRKTSRIFCMTLSSNLVKAPSSGPFEVGSRGARQTRGGLSSQSGDSFE